MTEDLSDGLLLHASAVAFDNRGVLILGPSGSGKSALALQLMAVGCTLVSDDGVLLIAGETGLLARAPDTIAGRIEARGIGLLTAASAPAHIVLVADMGETETHRLPPLRTLTVAGYNLPLVHRVESAHFPAAILQYLKAGRSA